MQRRLLAAVVASLVTSSACESQSLVRAADSNTAIRKPTDMERTAAYQLESKILAQTRPILIGLPRSYEKTKRTYPVLIVLDGEAQFPIAVTVASQLAALGHMPETIVVGIPNLDPMMGRVHDMTPPGLAVSGSGKNEGGDRFLDFIEKELMPALKSQQRANGMIVLEGHSSGGIIASYAAATRPAFRFVLSLDVPAHLGENWIPERLYERAQRGGGQLRYVSLEARFGWRDSTWNQFANAAPSEWKLVRQKLDNESHVSMVFVGLYVGLRELFSDYQVNKAPESPTTRTLVYYREMEKAWGYPVVPPPGLLRRLVEDLEMEGQAKPAADAYQLLVEGFGAPADSAEMQTRLANLAKLPPLTETVEGLLSTPRPRTSAAATYLGEWRGADWMNPEDKHETRLRLRDSAGVLTGEWVSFPEAGVEHIQKLTYIKVDGDRFTYGFMNGMRPRGMLLFEGRRTGDALKGTMRFGGVRIVPPAGEPGPPPIYFELKKSAEVSRLR